MSDPFIGEIKLVAFTYPPRGWAFCNGQLLAINQNQALFSILGTTYGGNGITNFALPNLQGRHPMHGASNSGAAGGELTHALTLSELPAHSHPPVAATSPGSPGTDPSGGIWAAQSTVGYASSPDTGMLPAAVSQVGASQPHDNTAPYLVLNFVIALVGIFPSRN